MDLMGELPRMNQQEIVDFIKACQHECGGISASIGHDPHLLYTLSAVQVADYSRILYSFNSRWYIELLNIYMCFNISELAPL